MFDTVITCGMFITLSAWYYEYWQAQPSRSFRVTASEYLRSHCTTFVDADGVVHPSM